MIRWVDVNEGDWFFSEIMEASSILLEDGHPLIAGVSYNGFLSDAPFLYEEQTGVKGKKTFTLLTQITPTPTNPLFVYIDGVQTVYKSATVNAGGTSDVELFVSPPQGSVVSFSSIGKPEVDQFGQPVAKGGTPVYPNHSLEHGDTYYYEPFSRQYQEYAYAFGRQLYRANVDDAEWDTSDGQTLAKKYIGNNQDVYMVSPSRYGGFLYLPFNLDGVTVKFTYNSMEDGVIKMRGGNFKASGAFISHNNRFFPNAKITRGEAFSLIDRVRKTFYSRFTDKDAPTNQMNQTIISYEGQKLFQLDSRFKMGSSLVVTLNTVVRLRDIDYTEFDDHTVIWNTPLPAGLIMNFTYNKVSSDRFQDVGSGCTIYDNTTGTTVSTGGSLVPQGNTPASWWAVPVASLEDEKFADGQNLIAGLEISNFSDPHYPVVDHMYKPIDGTDPKEIWFMPLTLMTRADSVSILNRFRKWSIERFK
jgi:hypothetical protein